LLALFSSAEHLRSAIMLRDILGPPRCRKHRAG
jgi:hypothetical protein